MGNALSVRKFISRSGAQAKTVPGCWAGLCEVVLAREGVGEMKKGTVSHERVVRMLGVVRSAYAGATFQERMTAVSRALEQVIPCAGLTAIMINPETLAAPLPEHCYYQGVSPEDFRDYPTYYVTLDPCRSFCIGQGLGQATLLSRFLPDRLWDAEEYSTDFLKRAGIRHILGGCLPMPDGWIMVYSAIRAPSQPDFREDETRLLQLLYPDVARTAFGALVMEKVREGADLRAECPDRGVLILSDAGDVVHADPGARALLAEISAGERMATDLVLAEARTFLAASTSTRAWSRSAVLPLTKGGWVQFTLVRPGPDPLVSVVLQRLAPGARAACAAEANRAGLTPREMEVALLVGQGLSNLEIANRLGLALETVKVHLRRALRKTGADGRAELCARLLGAGLTTEG